jgi:hypothetical protein
MAESRIWELRWARREDEEEKSPPYLGGVGMSSVCKGVRNEIEYK